MNIAPLFPLSALWLLACSGESTQRGRAADSASQDSAPVLAAADVRPAQPQYVAGDSLADVIRERVLALVGALDDHVASHVNILVTRYTRYENAGETTCYFDTTFALRYCQGSWDAEGNSGRYTYCFDGDSLLAALEENDYNGSGETVMLHSGFGPVYGFTTSATGTGRQEEQEERRWYDEPRYRSKREQVESGYRTLIQRLRASRNLVVVSGEEVSLRIENAVSYAQDFVESEEYTVNRSLFNELVRE